MAKLVKSRTLRSYEHFVWMMTGRHFEVTFDVRPLEIVIKGQYV